MTTDLTQRQFEAMQSALSMFIEHLRTLERESTHSTINTERITIAQSMLDPTNATDRAITRAVDKAVALERERCLNIVRDWQDRAYSSDEVLRLIREGRRP